MSETRAPGQLELVRAFINTTEIGVSDEFATAEGVIAWFEGAGLLESPVVATDRIRDAVVEVREALRAVAAGNHVGPVDGGAVDVLNEAARDADISLQFTSDGAEVRPLAPGAAGALGRLLAIVAEAMRDGTWARFKVCQNDECQWAFYDHARNRSGKWCDMAGCGNRMKARAYRARLMEERR